MSELSQAFKPLLSQRLMNHRTEVFKNDWYSYEKEYDKNNNNDKVDLNVIVPTLQKMSIKKPIKRDIPKREDTSELLLSSLFQDWSVRDLLICIIILQLFLLITIALK